MKNTIIVILLAISTGNLCAQPRCANEFNAKKNKAQKVKMEAFYKRVQEYSKQQPKTMLMMNNPTGIIFIPVVVHVVHNGAAQNISDQQICSQIDVLNEDFGRFNADASATPLEFQGSAANTAIQFYLATTDPSGNPSNGITRTSTTSTFNIGNYDKVKSTTTGGANPWNTQNYLNI